MILGTRAVNKRINPGWGGACTHCGARLKFAARQNNHVILCNVYEGDRWDRLEQYHPACYLALGEPYGSAVEVVDPRYSKRRA